GDLRVMGRATQGVKLINIKDNDSIAAVAKVMHEEDVADVTDENDIAIDNGTEIENNEEDNLNQE
ncbi:MAG TPA: DNA gyrase C-terminal beta-propeller domain-containing protein, partial [Lutibacter sp.]|nr:DNA gyrase C-terminal beta-propeller domain-containing protein [Lutibacter sp.]